MSRVCVTGAAGFIASHVITDLLEDGHVVHATVRHLGDDAKRAHLDVLKERYSGKLQCFEADLLEAGSLDAALEGCDALIHTATAVILAAPDPQKQIIDVAVKGTQNVLDSVARTPSVKRIVMTSSIAAVMSYDQQDKTYTEEDWCTSDDIWLDPYGMGKTQSERLLWRFVDEHADRVQAVAINPSVVIGPPLAKHHIRSSLSFIRDLVGWPGRLDLSRLRTDAAAPGRCRRRLQRTCACTDIGQSCGPAHYFLGSAEIDTRDLEGPVASVQDAYAGVAQADPVHRCVPG
jgi:dihydroflavonol-4-reductase